jgi:hypothetical protein
MTPGDVCVCVVVSAFMSVLLVWRCDSIDCTPVVVVVAAAVAVVGAAGQPCGCLQSGPTVPLERPR